MAAIQVIDAHCHAIFRDLRVGPWDVRQAFQDYLQRAKAAGIHQTVLFPHFDVNYTKANGELGRFITNHPGRFFGFAFVHAKRDQGNIFQMVEQTVVRYGFCGIKVHMHDYPISEEICEVADFFRLPVLYDVLAVISQVDQFAKKFPDVNFIIPHLGSFEDKWKAQLDFLPRIRRFDNVFTDTSGVKLFDLLQLAVNQAGAEKILFGTDAPWLHPGLELSKVCQLHLKHPEQDLQKILSGNFLKLTRTAKAMQTAY